MMKKKRSAKKTDFIQIILVLIILALFAQYEVSRKNQLAAPSEIPVSYTAAQHSSTPTIDM